MPPLAFLLWTCYSIYECSGRVACTTTKRASTRTSKAPPTRNERSRCSGIGAVIGSRALQTTSWVAVSSRSERPARARTRNFPSQAFASVELRMRTIGGGLVPSRFFSAITPGPLEASHSGLVHRLGKAAGSKGSREFESLRLRQQYFLSGLC